MMESYECFNAVDDILLKELIRKYKKQWRRKNESKNLIDWILYRKCIYEIDWKIFDEAKKKLKFRLITDDGCSIRSVVRHIVWKEI